MRQLLIVTALLVPAAALAAPDRNQVELSLSGIERVPGKQALLRLGPGVDQVLREIVLKPSRRALARTRAIALLRLFPAKETTAVLQQVISATGKAKQGLALLNLQQALASYAVVVGPPSLATVKPFLSHGNVDVRYAAAEAVRLGRSKEAISVLRQRELLEPSPTVRHQLKRQVELIRRPPTRR